MSEWVVCDALRKKSRSQNTIMGKITDLFCQVSIIVFVLVVVDLYFLFLFLFPWALFKR